MQFHDFLFGHDKFHDEIRTAITAFMVQHKDTGSTHMHNVDNIFLLYPETYFTLLTVCPKSATVTTTHHHFCSNYFQGNYCSICKKVIVNCVIHIEHSNTSQFAPNQPHSHYYTSSFLLKLFQGNYCSICK